MREAERVCILFTDSISNSAVPNLHEYYNMIILVIWLICVCLRKEGCVLLINWEKE